MVPKQPALAPFPKEIRRVLLDTGWWDHEFATCIYGPKHRHIVLRYIDTGGEFPYTLIRELSGTRRIHIETRSGRLVISIKYRRD